MRTRPSISSQTYPGSTAISASSTSRSGRPVAGIDHFGRNGGWSDSMPIGTRAASASPPIFWPFNCVSVSGWSRVLDQPPIEHRLREQRGARSRWQKTERHGRIRADHAASVCSLRANLFGAGGDIIRSDPQAPFDGRLHACVVRDVLVVRAASFRLPPATILTIVTSCRASSQRQFGVDGSIRTPPSHRRGGCRESQPVTPRVPHGRSG